MRGKLNMIFITLIIFIQLIVINTNSISTISQNSQTITISFDELSLDNANKLLSTTPFAFTENSGQLENDEVRFYTQGGGLWFTDDGVWFEIREELKIESRESRVGSREFVFPFDPMAKLKPPELMKYKYVILKQEFVNANIVKPEGRRHLTWNSNFFYGNDSSKWQTEVPNYREVYYENLYEGVDLRYYTNKNGLKYDFIVHPGANPNQIRLRYEGAKDLEINEFRNLIIKTNIKDVVDSDLFIYQDYAGEQHQVVGRFKIYDDLEYGFEIINDYRLEETLIIDPDVRLEYSTFIGGVDSDFGFSIAVDSVGNAYVTGYTYSYDFPTTPGAYNRSYNGGNWDVFVFKLNQNASALIYSTYLGGSNDECGTGIAVDSTGNAFVFGDTGSSNFPTTIGAYNTTLNGKEDVFVVKLNHNGSMLIYSTFVGGTNDEYSEYCNIIIDDNGNAFVTGETSSSDFPTTKGAFDTTYNGSYDIFILKLNQNGSKLLYSTFIGGGNRDVCYAITLDSQRNIYITGYTLSLDFPTTPNAYDASLNNGDIFILKLNQNASKLIYSTFLGGNSSSEIGCDIVVDKNGNAYVTGYTYSYDFPTTPDAYDTSFNGGYDAFILKLNKTGSKLLYSTFIGGNDGCESGTGIIVDAIGNAYITGWTWSTSFPTTPDAYDNSYNLGFDDAFFLKLNSNGSTLLYSTFIGGSSVGVSGESGNGITLDSYGNVLIAGTTLSSDFPTTLGAFDTTYNQAEDVFVLKFSFQYFFNVTSISLLKDDIQTDLIYSRLLPYTFKVNIIDTFSFSDLKEVRLNLDPSGTNIQLLWDRASGKFSKIFDPHNYVAFESSSKAIYNCYEWIVDFNLTFSWTYPDEDFHGAEAIASSKTFSPDWLNVTDLYCVENDLVFKGNLSVKGGDNRTIYENELLCGGE